ncbi:MAG: alpha/beta hydrolase, partial [Rubrobacter sp.]|nr:alpha/beta hydrolase [Rubrobacter sp.]
GRPAAGVLIHEHLVNRPHELGAFIEAAVKEHALDPAKPVMVGYSDRANVAAILVLLRPGLLRAAVLFRAMVSFQLEVIPNLTGTSVYMVAGHRDRYCRPRQS